MASSQTGLLLRQLRRLAADEAALSDAELLERFAGRRDEAAFTELVRRHGPLVLGVCRSVLRQEQDAEDAFQAAFLALARQASAVRRGESVGGWLHAVAYRLALKARARSARRSAVERQAPPAPAGGDPLLDASVRDLLAAVHEELSRLPEKYRAPLVLCYLQGRTQDEAARQLGCSEGTLRGRLFRGRERLRARLARRGLALPGALGPFLLAHGLSAAAVPAALAEGAIRAGLGESPPRVAALAAAARGLGPVKLRLAAVVVLALGALGLGAALAVLPQPVVPRPQPQPPGEARAPARPEEPPADAQGDPLPEGAVARLGTVRFRYWRSIGGIALSPDGKHLVVCPRHDHADLPLFDAATGRQVRLLRASRQMGGAVAFSPDSREVAAASYDGVVRRWETATGKPLPGLKGVPRRNPSSLYCQLAYSPDGKTLAGSFHGAMVRAWDLKTGKLLPQITGDHSKHLLALAFSPDSNLLAVAGWDNPPKGSYFFRLWDVATGKPVRQFVVKGGIESLAFTPDGKGLVCGGHYERGPVLWDVETQRAVRRFDSGAERTVLAVALSPDGKLLASADREVRLWDVATGKQLRSLPQAARHLAFAPDGRTLYAASDAAIRVWDALTGEERSPLPGHRGALSAVRCAPDGRLIVTAGRDGTIRGWDLAGKELLHLSGQAESGVAFRPDGKLMAVGCVDPSTEHRQPNGVWATGARLRLWEPATGKEVDRFKGDRGHVNFVAFTRGGKVLVRGDAWDATVRLLDVATGKEVGRLNVALPGKGPRFTRFAAMALSHDGTRLATGDPRTDNTSALLAPCAVRIWDVATGKLLHKLDAHLSEPAALAFSPDGRLLVSGGHSFRNNGINIWDVATGKLLRTLPVEGQALAFSPDGRALATAGNHQEIWLWETKTWRARGRFVGHGTRVTALAFTADGRRLVSASEDATALVWDVGQAIKGVTVEGQGS
jgi:RNA polymerase sigma factor (sigma-70 family)